MSALRQIVLSALVLAGALYLWISYVPSSLPLLERAGVLEVLGIEPGPAVAEAGGQRRGGGPVQVIAAAVTERQLADRITAIGDGGARRAVTVRSEAVGLVTDITLAAGSRVEAGSIIARLENEAESIALERARITLEDAQAEMIRVARLQDTGAVTAVRLREVELALRTAELTQRQALFELSQREIIAPISGWIGILDVEVGDRVSAEEILATITDRSALLINFRVPERVIPLLKIGMAVSVAPLGLRDTTIEGEISAIDTVVDRDSRTLRVQGRVDNSDDRLRVGMAFSVALTFPGETLLSIDPLALQWASDGAYVWVIREDKVARVPVAIRQRNSDDILVEADLAPGDMIVTEGLQSLRPGAEVVIANPAKTAATPPPTPAGL
jgi:RND family efflux transporter MFP subunit